MKRSADLKSQLALSKRSGVGQTTIGRILRSETNPGAEVVRKLARALQVPVAALFGEPVKAAEPENGTSREFHVVSGATSHPGRLDFGTLVSTYQQLVGHFEFSGGRFDPEGDASLLVAALNYAMDPTPDRLEERDRRTRELLDRRKQGIRDGRSSTPRSKPAR